MFSTEILRFPVYKQYMYSQKYFSCLHYNIVMKFVSYHRGKMVLSNDTKHDRFCKSVTEIKDHARNFPNAPRISNPTLIDVTSTVDSKIHENRCKQKIY